MGRTLLREAVVPALLAAVGALELADMRPEGWQAAIAVEALACAILVGRRRAPLLCGTAAPLVVLTLPWIGPRLDEPATPILIATVSLYTLGRRPRDLRGIGGVAVVAAMIFADYLLVDEREHGWGDVVYVGALMLPPYVFGRVIRLLVEQKAQLEAAHALVRDQAVREERERIARDLHDVMAHSVSAMVVQTAAAQDLVVTDPGRAEAVLADVADTGRRALADTGRLLHVLRDGADELGLHPPPGLAELPHLVQSFREQGLAVEADLPREAPALPGAVDVSMYRIAAELLTNALRYAADRAVRIRVTFDGGSVIISADNRSSGGTGAGTGLGLAGVAERVSVLGGTLRHGPVGERFEVEARLPVAP